MDHRQSAAALVMLFAVLMTAFPYQSSGQQVSQGITITATVPGSSSDGSSGGVSGGSAVPRDRATVIFSGRAYPGSSLTILEGGIRRGTDTVGRDATFTLTLENIPPGNHTYGLYATDRDGVRSAIQSFPILVTANLITTVSGIFTAPTVSLNKQRVDRDESVTIHGQTVPGGEVSLIVRSAREFTFFTTANDSGLYSYTFPAALLDAGTYKVQAQTRLGSAVSALSRIPTFQIGDGLEFPINPDLNGDDRIDLIDFSIVTYWFKKEGPPAHVDLNGDGQISLVDFSIMAYRWTG